MQAHDGADSFQPAGTASASAWGLRWWATVLLAVSATAVGAVADMRINHGLGGIFQASFGLGCVIAVCVARRGEIFGPMLQPPLILAGVAVPVVLLWSPAAAHGPLVSRVITAGLPVIDNFPVAAATTVVTVVIGVVRMTLRRKPVESGNSEVAEESSHTSRRVA
jgi:hypothetical protein